MSDGQTRWRRLRRRGVFPNPSQDLQLWEAQLIDSLASLGSVALDRWVIAGPVGGATAQGLATAVGAIEPGWLIRLAPTALVNDIPLPELGLPDAGRMVAVQHVGATRSIIRLNWGSLRVAGCTSPGHIATCVWDGRAWFAVTGRVEWTDLPSNCMVPVASWDTPGGGFVDDAAVGNWGHMLCYSQLALQEMVSGFHFPRTWIGTDIKTAVVVVPLASGNGTIQWQHVWAFGGVEAGLPLLPSFASDPPAADLTSYVPMVVTTANWNIPKVIGPVTIPSPATRLTTTDCVMRLDTIRHGNYAGDTYTAGATDNVCLHSSSIRVQTCQAGSPLE